MKKAKQQAITNPDSAKSAPVTESGEIERPVRRRRIDCGGNPEVTDRFAARNGARRRPDDATNRRIVDP
jgi:hypothetical protein